jgi:hypothetical protein
MYEAAEAKRWGTTSFLMPRRKGILLRGLVSLIKRVYFGGQKGEVYKSLSTLFIVLLRGR